jgi:glycosyltransferase involved in cell wall biosynthesis
MKNSNSTHINYDRNSADHDISQQHPDEPAIDFCKDTFKKEIYHVLIIIPIHNEEANIESVTLSTLNALRLNNYKPSILLVDDGSRDRSKEIIASLSSIHSEVNFISFSKNFGKEAAIMAGLRECGDDYDVLAYMDSDGQHSADDLLKLLAAANSTDVDLVCGARIDRDYQTVSQRLMTKGFYRVFHAVTEATIEEGVGDFNVLRPKVVRALREMREEHPFMKGLVSWVGFKKIIVPITIQPRSGGEAKSSTVKMLRLALGAILSFSSWPLRAWSIIGMISAILAICYLIAVVVQTSIYGIKVPGYATTVVLLLGIGGLQLLSIGILGEYVARIYNASKRRPQYIISERS